MYLLAEASDASGSATSFSQYSANQLLPSRFKGGGAIIVNLVFFCNVELLFINNAQKMLTTTAIIRRVQQKNCTSVILEIMLGNNTYWKLEGAVLRNRYQLVLSLTLLLSFALPLK
ncbi:unnamed protein product [Prunus armeniaca]